MSEPTKAIFLSYAREDADAARRIAEALRAFGVEVWFDQSELRGGDAWDQTIRTQIKTCALFMPIVSARTEERTEGYFRREWKLAVDRTHDMVGGRAFIVPIVIDGTAEKDAAVPEEFMRYQWTRLWGGEATPEFVSQVKRLLEVPRKPATTGGSPATAPTNTAPTNATDKAAPRGARWTYGSAMAVVVAIATALYVGRKPAAPAAAAANPPGKSAAPAVVAPVADKSIAVLPFANMSEDKDSAFFADGMHEDILTNLAMIRELRVTSRTSVMEYRGTTKKIRQIGAELGVAYVLEGSVRRAGNKVRVTGQLINVATDEHVWAKSYDRDLNDIFAIQSELSQAIATALAAALSPQERERIDSRPTTNLAAYDLFLKARAWDLGYDLVSSAEQAEQWLQEAVRLDPSYAQAWALLSSVNAATYFASDRTPERLARIQSMLETAVKLAPDDPVVIECQGTYYYRALKDYAQAAVLYRRLLALNPNSATAYAYLGFLERRQGRWLEALAYLEKSVQLDPRSPIMVWEIGDLHRDLRHYDEAATAFRRAAELAPADLEYGFELNSVPFYARGSTKEMEAWLAQIRPAQAGDHSPLFYRREWARLRGDYATAVNLDREHPYLDPFDDPHFRQDVMFVLDLVGQGDAAGARERARLLAPAMNRLVETQSSNGFAWLARGWCYATLGEKEEALRSMRRARELLPESLDAKSGPEISLFATGVLAWSGDKDTALAELARLLRTPRGANVHQLRAGIFWQPLRGDPRFEALLNDPKNNQPLF